MPGKVKVNGAWKDVASAAVKVNGSWKEVIEAYTKVNSVWEQWFQAGFPAVAGYIHIGNGNFTVEKLNYATETFSNTTPSPDPSQSRAGFSNPSVAGYMLQGADNFGSLKSGVWKWSFPSDSQSTVSDNHPWGSNEENTGMSNFGVAGYFTTRSKTNVYKWTFPTDTRTQTTSTSFKSEFGNGFANPSVAGYITEGDNGTIVNKYAFPTDTRTTATALPSIQAKGGAFSNAGVAGYTSKGGYTSGTSNMFKYTFPSDTVSTTTALPFLSYRAGGHASSGVAGYIYAGPSSFQSVGKYAFPSDTVSTLTSNNYPRGIASWQDAG